MRGASILLVIASLGSAGSTAGNSETGSQFIAYAGEAVAAASGRFLYSERHILQYRDGRLRARVVLYSCMDGAPFAHKIASYADPLAPDFLFEDSSNGMRQGVRSSGSLRTVFFRPVWDASEKTASLDTGSGLVVDAGFDEFIRANWSSLMAGRAISMRFLVPSRLQSISFQVQHVRSGQDGVAIEVFRLKLHGVLGWVFPGIDVSYSADDRLLVRYQGLSDLRDRYGDNLPTTITFRSEDRRAVDAQAFAAATQAALAPCTT